MRKLQPDVLIRQRSMVSYQSRLGHRILTCCAALLISYFSCSVVQAASKAVELELVLAIDTSTSVNAQEFELQRTGLARAFRQPNVQAAIASLGKDGLAVCVVQWAGTSQQIVALDWVQVNSKGTAEHVADRLSAMPRLTRGTTDIAGALNFSTNQIRGNRFEGRRKTIDVSGDGTSDELQGALDPRPFRDFALAQGIIINGLVIFSEEYDLGDLAAIDLEKHYRENVIGGPGHFLEQADRFQDFATAIQKKLVREITGPSFVQR